MKQCFIYRNMYRNIVSFKTAQCSGQKKLICAILTLFAAIIEGDTQIWASPRNNSEVHYQLLTFRAITQTPGSSCLILSHPWSTKCVVNWKQLYNSLMNCSMQFLNRFNWVMENNRFKKVILLNRVISSVLNNEEIYVT